MGFQDHFSGHAKAYAAARPRYPVALFDWLASLCARRELAWDAGTGNGQAALALADHFNQVVATEPSAEQLAAAPRHARIDFRVEPAEAPSLGNGAVDLVTVAQAYHWFDQDAFHAAVRRVLHPEGVIAVWCYGLCAVDAEVDRVFTALYQQVLGGYWPAERRHVENGYRDLPFPYREIDALPAFAMQVDWSLEDYLAYLRTWSATQRYQRATGVDPVAAATPAFLPAWGPAQSLRAVRFPLALRVGRLN